MRNEGAYNDYNRGSKSDSARVSYDCKLLKIEIDLVEKFGYVSNRLCFVPGQQPMIRTDC